MSKNASDNIIIVLREYVASRERALHEAITTVGFEDGFDLEAHSGDELIAVARYELWRIEESMRQLSAGIFELTNAEFCREHEMSPLTEQRMHEQPAEKP